MDEHIFERLQSVINMCQSGLLNGDPHLLHLGKMRLNNCISSLVSAIPPGIMGENVDAMVDNVFEKLISLRNVVEQDLAALDRVDAVYPVMELNWDFIILLRKQGMPWSKIADLHGISRQTLYNHRRKNNISEPNSLISEPALEEYISKMSMDHPKAGTGFMQGALLAAGFRVSRRRVWQCLRRVDPIGTQLRRKKCVTRRVYKVNGANHLWHIDSNHKLIMYKFVIHGATDGFSRLVIHLNVATDNLSATVLKLFKSSAAELLLPKRVRGDKGVENRKVRYYMRKKSSSSRPFIPGRSVHNTRIERLWRDVNIQVVHTFKAIFQNLEEQEKLDEHSDLDLWCLAYVFQPRIQEALNKFQTWWNNHTMRTMKNRTPSQVWTMQMMRQGDKCYSHIIEDDSDSDVEISDEPEEVDIQHALLYSRMPPLIREELNSIIPDPMVDDGALGTNHYNVLRTHLLNVVADSSEEFE